MIFNKKILLVIVIICGHMHNAMHSMGQDVMLNHESAEQKERNEEFGLATPAQRQQLNVERNSAQRTIATFAKTVWAKNLIPIERSIDDIRSLVECHNNQYVLKKTVTLFPDPIYKSTVSPSRKYVATAYETTVSLWNVSNDRLLSEDDEHARTINDIAFIADDCFVCASADKNSSIWKIDESHDACCKKIYLLQGHTGSVNATVIKNKTKILTASDDCSVRLWNAVTGNQEKIFMCSKSPIKSMANIAHCSSVALITKDNSLMLLNIQTGATVYLLKKQPKIIKTVVPHPSSPLFIHIDQAGKSQLWDAMSLKSLLSFDDVFAAAFANNGNEFSITSRNNPIMTTWQLPHNKLTEYDELNQVQIDLLSDMEKYYAVHGQVSFAAIAQEKKCTVDVLRSIFMGLPYVQRDDLEKQYVIIDRGGPVAQNACCVIC